MRYRVRAAIVLLAAACFATFASHAQAVDPDAWKQPDVRAHLKTGMTPDQVEAVLGTPARSRIHRSLAGNTRDLEFRSSNGRDWMIAVFMDGQGLFNYSVARLGADGDGLPVDAQPWRVLANWQALAPGMSLDEVEAIFGPPSAKAYTGIDGVETLTGWLYDVTPETGPASGMVMAVQDRVSGISTPLLAVP